MVEMRYVILYSNDGYKIKVVITDNVMVNDNVMVVLMT